MRQPLSRALIVATLAVPGPSGHAIEPLKLEHLPAGCVVRDSHPRIDVRIVSQEPVQRARVFFHAGQSPAWYAVELRRDSTGTWSAALPQPKLERFGYYLVAFGPTSQDRLPRTGAFAVEVASTCAGPTLETAPEGPTTVGLVGAAPESVTGFRKGDIRQFLTGIDGDARARPTPR